MYDYQYSCESKGFSFLQSNNEVSVKIASLSSHALVSCSVLGQLSIKTIVVDIYSSTHLISVDTKNVGLLLWWSSITMAMEAGLAGCGGGGRRTFDWALISGCDQSCRPMGGGQAGPAARTPRFDIA